MRGSHFGIVTGDRLDDPADPNRVDRLVDARELHRAAETKTFAHRRHRDPGLAQDGANAWPRRRRFERQAVALARLHRKHEAQIAHELLRPDAGAEHELVGLERTRTRLYGIDVDLAGAPGAHFGVMENLHAGALELAPQHRHQA